MKTIIQSKTISLVDYIKSEPKYTSQEGRLTVEIKDDIIIINGRDDNVLFWFAVGFGAYMERESKN